MAEGSGGRRACLDDPTELPHAKQMPCLPSSGRRRWQEKTMLLSIDFLFRPPLKICSKTAAIRKVGLIAEVNLL